MIDDEFTYGENMKPNSKQIVRERDMIKGWFMTRVRGEKQYIDLHCGKVRSLALTRYSCNIYE